MCIPVKEVVVVDSSCCFCFFGLGIPKNKVSPIICEPKVQEVALPAIAMARASSLNSVDSGDTNKAVMIKMVAFFDRERSTSLKYFV